MNRVGKVLAIFLFVLQIFQPVTSFADTTATTSATTTDIPFLSPSPSLCPTITVSASNSANLTNTVTNTSSTGDNIASGQVAASPSATPSPSTPITTGSSITTTTAENTINTNLQNSQVEFQTINIFLNSDNSLDLNAPLAVAAHVASTNATPSANILMTSVTNYATLTNDITAVDNTGDNSASSSGDLIINTGNAYALVQLLNKVNLTLVDSTIHIVSVNIYGTMNGNIILPDTPHSTGSQVLSLTATNNATVTNTIQNTSDTGGNTTLTAGSGTISTGNATSIVNVTNIINTILLNATFEHLYINTFGQWQGNFLGWEGLSPQSGGESMDLVQMSDTSTSNNTNEGNMNVSNTANVTNTISNTANSGGNVATGENSAITTGNAYAYINLMNFINSLFVNSHGFFGFINIFGALNGNIGGQSAFVTPTPSAITDTIPDSSVYQENLRELQVSTYNNVATYIHPGDTITVFATVKNIGTGRISNTMLNIQLMQNGQAFGQATYPLGNIDPGQQVKFSTGLVLSKGTPSGEYTAQVTVEGITGHENLLVGDRADSYFTIQTPTFIPVTNLQNATPTVIPTPTKELVREILGASIKQTTNTDMSLYYALFAIIIAYIAIRILRAHRQFLALFAQNKSLRERVNILRLFLL